jgi:hypothetical protein
MLQRFFCLSIGLIIFACTAYAQQDSLTKPTDSIRHVYRPRPMTLLDSVARAIKLEEQAVSDSLALIYVLRPNSSRTNLFADSIIKASTYTGNHFLDLATNAATAKRSVLGYGHVRPARDRWVIAVIIVLLLFTALLNIFATKDLSNIFISFYSRKSTQTGKEDSPITTWIFIGLFLLFGFTFGLFLYLLTTGYYKVYYAISGIQLFLRCLW